MLGKPCEGSFARIVMETLIDQLASQPMDLFHHVAGGAKRAFFLPSLLYSGERSLG